MTYQKLLANNRAWIEQRLQLDPGYFESLAAVHAPQFLWVGCSDARVPANEITGTIAGEMFVHRNIANQVVPSDANFAAVLQYAVDVLQVKDVIVCGHEECGGVKAALAGGAPPAVDAWLAHVRTVARLHRAELDALEEAARVPRLVELNVAEQLGLLARMPTVLQAWDRGAELRLHGWVYGLRDGRLRDLGLTMDGRQLAAA